MNILIKPIITEKATADAEDQNQFSFVVHRDANKIQIREAIQTIYNVNVESVNTMVVAGKRKMRYTKTGILSGTTGAYKKAVVTVRSGETLDLYSNI
jgi:large subunit ribosomal protein L23